MDLLKAIAAICRKFGIEAKFGYLYQESRPRVLMVVLAGAEVDLEGLK